MKSLLSLGLIALLSAGCAHKAASAEEAKIYPNKDNDPVCKLAGVKNAELFEKVLTVPEGSTVEQATQFVGTAPDGALWDDEDDQGKQAEYLVWTPEVAEDKTLQLFLSFRGKKSSDKAIQLVTGIGTDNELECAWNVR